MVPTNNSHSTTTEMGTSLTSTSCVDQLVLQQFVISTRIQKGIANPEYFLDCSYYYLYWLGAYNNYRIDHSYHLRVCDCQTKTTPSITPIKLIAHKNF